MSISSKQRAYLKGLAMNEDTIIMVGKSGVTDKLVLSAAEALRARELVKGKVLESSPLTAREVCDELCARCGAEGVQCIGTKFVLYRRNDKEPKITLPKDGKKT